MPQHPGIILKINGRKPPVQRGFRAALQSDGILELVIYEEIGFDWWTGGGITAKGVKEEIDRAGNYSSVLIRINSPGGDAFEGIAIYNLLRAQKKPIEVCVDGIAASAASIIAMAGDVITMGPNAMMMIHNAWAVCMGEAADMRKMADALDKISVSIAQTYVTKTGKTLEEVVALMDAETWMTAQECLELGFATAVAGDPNSASAGNALALARTFKALKHMKRVPENLKTAPKNDPDPEVECSCDCEACQDGDCPNCSNPDCNDPNCVDCPMQGDASAAAIATAPAPESNLSLYEASATMLLRGQQKTDPQTAQTGV